MSEKVRLDGIECILGSECVDMRLGYAGILIIGFNRLVENDHPKLKHKYRGEWELRSDQATWRVLADNKILCGEYDDSNLISSVFSTFHGLPLLEYENGPSVTDLRLSFTGGLCLEIACTSSEMNSWELSGPSKNYIPRTDGRFGDVECNKGLIVGLSEEEKELSNRSEQCHKRWQPKVPLEGKEKCKSCHYYLPLESRFFFSDYGVCTNADSSSDGCVVGINSYCLQFVEVVAG